VILKEDRNWRLIKNSDRGKYCFLIGVNDWAVELDKNEFECLSKLLIKLHSQISSMKNELMDEELINLEIEKAPWYVELEGNKNEWDLRILFESNNVRSFQMYWPIPIAQTLLIEIIKMWESMY
tara:strand:+ start:2307 stop:2678 length:372 start_codon:yes stop_codon:yes gene_type:complete